MGDAVLPVVLRPDLEEPTSRVRCISSCSRGRARSAAAAFRSCGGHRRRGGYGKRQAPSGSSASPSSPAAHPQTGSGLDQAAVGSGVDVGQYEDRHRRVPDVLRQGEAELAAVEKDSVRVPAEESLRGLAAELVEPVEIWGIITRILLTTPSGNRSNSSQSTCCQNFSPGPTSKCTKVLSSSLRRFDLMARRIIRRSYVRSRNLRGGVTSTTSGTGPWNRSLLRSS